MLQLPYCCYNPQITHLISHGQINLQSLLSSNIPIVTPLTTSSKSNLSHATNLLDIRDGPSLKCTPLEPLVITSGQGGHTNHGHVGRFRV